MISISLESPLEHLDKGTAASSLAHSLLPVLDISLELSSWLQMSPANTLHTHFCKGQKAEGGVGGEGYRHQGTYTLVSCLPEGFPTPSDPPRPSLLLGLAWPCPLNPITSWCHPWEQPDSGAAAAALTFSSSSVTSFLELEQVTSFLGTELGSRGRGIGE